MCFKIIDFIIMSENQLISAIRPKKRRGVQKPIQANNSKNQQSRLLDPSIDSQDVQLLFTQNQNTLKQVDEDEPIGIFKISTTKTMVCLPTKEKKKQQKEEKKKGLRQKNKNMAGGEGKKNRLKELPEEPDLIARGHLVGTNNLADDDLFQKEKNEFDFTGTFEGSFEQDYQLQQDDSRVKLIYFEGKIQNIKILRKNKKQITDDDKQRFDGLQLFVGYFKGRFLKSQWLVKKLNILQDVARDKGQPYDNIKKKKDKVNEYNKKKEQDRKEQIENKATKTKDIKKDSNETKKEEQEKKKKFIADNFKEKQKQWLEQYYGIESFIPLGKQQDLEKSIMEKGKEKFQYHVPTLVRFEARKIIEINLEKSSALIDGILYIDIHLNEEALGPFYDSKDKKFKQDEKQKLIIDFHRGRPHQLPFYNTEQIQDTDDEIQYQWDDVWEGIAMTSEWEVKKMRMSYRIRMIFTAEIDNSHGIFYAPFNLNVLRIIVDFHAIKYKDKNSQKEHKISFNCCDLTDYNSPCYNPYTFFQELECEESLVKKIALKKHIDRLTKIDVTHFEDQGEFKIANNRTSLFPYHRRVLKNKNGLTKDIGWTLGIASRSALVEPPKAFSVRQAFQDYKSTGHWKKFEPRNWEFVHIQIPIFKYPVIDMIRIFVPIMILSTISLAIFWQENAKDFNNFTELAKRIASGCSLMIAYVALIPLIRVNLPPSPSVTLVEILIYLSTIPNFLAIIAVFTVNMPDVLTFFSKYRPYVDPLLIISFAICIFSFLIFAIMLVIYAAKNYKTSFTIYKFEPSPFSHIRSPHFRYYIKKIQQNRPHDIKVEEFHIDYQVLDGDGEIQNQDGSQ